MATESIWERPRTVRNCPLAIVGIAIVSQIITLLLMRDSFGAWRLRNLGIDSPSDAQIEQYRDAARMSAWLVIAFAVASAVAILRTRADHRAAPWVLAASLFGLWGLVALVGWGVPQLSPELGRQIMPWRALHMDGPPFYLPLLISFLLFRAIRQRIWTYELDGVVSQFD